MTKVVMLVALLAVATSAGTATTVGVYSARWETPNSLLTVCVFVAVVHLLLCGTNVLLSDTVTEDAVKSVMLMTTGGTLILLRIFPLLGLLAVSLAIFSFTASQTWQLLQSEREPSNGASD